MINNTIIRGKIMLEVINKYVIGNSVPTVLILAGVFFLIALRGRPVIYPKRMLTAMLDAGKKDESVKDEERISPFRSMTMALAGTLGVGNIVGVASAIAMGGFGAVFWMWVSAFAAMILKYAEIVLAIAHRRKGSDGTLRGGAVYYIKKCFENMKLPKVGIILSAIFAVLCIVDSLSMGCIVQVNAVSSAFNGVLGVPEWICGVILAFITVTVISRGSKSISKITEYLVPVMAIGYVIMSVAVMILCRERLWEAVTRIFYDAFNFKSTVGGIFGFLTSDALRYGTMRGLLSNEAGCGTAPFAHSTSSVKEPARQGVWGIFEVFADTILLCSMTAAVIILNYDACCAFSADGVMMTLRAYSAVIGRGAEYFLCIAIFLFAYATLICWAHYGLECVAYLTMPISRRGQSTARRVYILLFCICIFVGSVVAPTEVWTLADLSIGSMTLINVLVLCLSVSQVRYYTDRVFPKRKRLSGQPKDCSESRC